MAILTTLYAFSNLLFSVRQLKTEISCQKTTNYLYMCVHKNLSTNRTNFVVFLMYLLYFFAYFSFR